MGFSASAVMAGDRFGWPYYFLLRQLGWAAAGLAAMTIIMKIDYRRWKHPAIVFTLLGLTTLMLVAVFFLDRSHNTHRWVRLGALSFQPSELAKPALILFLAFFLESRLKSIDDWRHTLLPAMVPASLFAILIVKQPDLGTAVVCPSGTQSSFPPWPLRNWDSLAQVSSPYCSSSSPIAVSAPLCAPAIPSGVSLLPASPP